MKQIIGKWHGGGRIEYSGDECTVKISGSLWWVGLIMLVSLIAMAVNPEIWKHVTLRNPWPLALPMIIILMLFLFAAFMLESKTLFINKSEGFYILSSTWLALPVRKQSCSLSEIEQITIRERIMESSDHCTHYFHLYMTIQGNDIHFFELTPQLNEMSVRNLALFLKLPLVFTDKGIFQEGGYERVESIDDIQKCISDYES